LWSGFKLLQLFFATDENHDEPEANFPSQFSCPIKIWLFKSFPVRYVRLRNLSLGQTIYDLQPGNEAPLDAICRKCL